MMESKAVPDNFIELIKDLKRKSYFDLLADIQEELELTNYSQAEMEALLINVIVDFYSSNEDSGKIDIVLMALGLLKGFDNRTRTNSIEISVAKALYTKRITKFFERTNYNLTDNTPEAIRQCANRELGNLASEIYARKGDYEYLKESAEKYPSSHKDYIPEECLPDMFFYQWLENSSAQAPVLSAGYYIKKIRSSTHHDDVARDLYKALCGDGEPPYTKWVAAWIYKCINEKFKKTMDKDILLASFGILKNYELGEKNGLERRIGQYLENSLYIDTHPGESRFSSLGELLAIPKELKQLKEKLEKKESGLVEELIIYIEKDISDHKEHIKNLRGNPDSTDLLFSKRNIELSQEIQEARKKIMTFVVTGILGFLFCVFSLQIYELMHEEQVRKEAVFSYTWEKDESSQTESWITRSINDNDDSSGVEPVYAKNSQFSNGNFSEDT